MLEPPNRSKLPRPARALVGRERESAAALGALGAGGLVSLVGTGGVGKTRLALELAHRWTERGGRAVWVDLVAARSVLDVVRALAEELGERGEGSVASVGEAVARCGPVLVVLDNVEQLPAAVGDAIVTWVGAAADARWAVTSRQALGLLGERVVAVDPLAVPQHEREVLQSAAWTLFCAAAPRDPPADPRCALALLRTLEGIPLALELAAARLEVLALPELVQRLADRFALLVDPDAAGDRHAALYRAIDWSWSLLSAPERVALAQLSVFAGSFDMAAAEAVVVDVPVREMVEGLARRSLLGLAGDQVRLLESIRDFADRQLTGPARAAAIDRHAAWYGGQLDGLVVVDAVGQAATFDALARISAELARALHRAATEPRPSGPAMVCARGLVLLYGVRARAADVLEAADAALSLPEDPGDAANRVSIRIARALAIRRLGRPSEARAVLAELAASAEATPGRARARAYLGDIEQDLGRYEAAIAAYWSALPEYERFCAQERPMVLASLSTAYLPSGRRDEAEALIAEALATLTPGNLRAELEVRKADGWIGLERVDAARADRAYTAVAALASQVGDVRAVAFATGQRGIAAELADRLLDAIAHYDEASAAMRQRGDPIYAAYYVAYAARARMLIGEWDRGTADLRAVVGTRDLEPRLRDMFLEALALGLARAGQSAALSLAPDPPLVEAAVRGYAALRILDRPTLRRCAAELRGRDGAVDDAMARRLVVHVAAELEAGAATWRIRTDGTAFEPPDGDWIEVGPHPARHRMLAALASQKGQALDVGALVAAGWPGERILPAAAANRVRVALAALRKRGLGLLERTDDGWRLGARVLVVACS